MQQDHPHLFELVVFDWKGTLEAKLTPKKVRERNALQRLICHLELKYPTKSFNFEDNYDKQKIEVHKSMSNAANGLIAEATIDKVLDNLGISGKAEKQELIGIFQKEYHNLPGKQLIPGALQLLEKLTQLGISIILVRNTRSTFQEFQKTLIHFGVEKFFGDNNTVLAGEVGIRKPDRAIFEAVLNKSNKHELQQASPEKILMIGNETEADVKGAKEMGWKSVLLLTTEKGSGGLADWEFSSLQEVEDLLCQPTF